MNAPHYDIQQHFSRKENPPIFTVMRSFSFLSFCSLKVKQLGLINTCLQQERHKVNFLPIRSGCYVKKHACLGHKTVYFLFTLKYCITTSTNVIMKQIMLHIYIVDVLWTYTVTFD